MYRLISLGLSVPLMLIGNLSLVTASEPTDNLETKVDFCPKPEPRTEPRSFPIISFQQGERLITIQIVGSRIFNRDDIINYIRDNVDDSEIRSVFFNLEQGKSPSDQDIRLTKLYNFLKEYVALLYLDRGYFTSKVQGVNDFNFSENYTENILEIEVIEQGIQNIKIQGRERLNLSYICDRIRLGTGFPFNTIDLEEQLRLLRINPLFESIEADLIVRSQETDEIDLIVRVEEADPVTISLGIDNYSPPSIGSERTNTSFIYQNLTGLGDEVFASYSRSTTSGADSLNFNYRVPLSARNNTLQFRVAPYEQEVTQAPFDEFDIRRSSQLYEVSYQQPLIQSIRRNLVAFIGFEFQEDQTFLFDEEFPFGSGADEDGFSRTSTFKLGLNYIKRDPKGAWTARSQVNIGVDIFNATTNSPPVPDGQFFSWLTQTQRIHQLNNDNLLIVQADLQLTGNSLLPAQQFVIGGASSIRGYRQNVRSGDNGFRFSIEDRITVLRDREGISQIQIAPFFDMGAVWNVDDNPNRLLRQTFLAGAGVGFLWNNFLGIDNLIVRLDYGFPIIDLNDRGDNIQDDGLYFGVNYQLSF